MVKVRDDQPTLADGRLDLAGSVDVFCLLDGTIDRQRVIEAGTYLRGLPHGESLLSVGLAFGVLIAELELGTDAVIAAMLYRALHGRHATLADIEARFGHAVAKLTAEVHGMAAFTALQRRNIPSRFLQFPDENHWVLKPQNSKLWHQEVLAWIDRYTKKR